MAGKSDNGECSIKVTKSEPIVVHPAEKVKADEYYLSSLDQFPGIVKTVHLYKASEEKSTDDVSRVLREALEKVLVYYYPFDGTLTPGADGKLVLQCDERGVPFVEAVAECELAELGDINIPHPTKLRPLVYTIPNAKSMLDAPLLAIQVTRFKCGGFAVGVAMSHALGDGMSAGGFLNSWAETARGLSLSTIPFMDRTLQRARSPPRVEYPHEEYIDVEDVTNLSSIFSHEFICRAFTFDTNKLNRLKQAAAQNCSSFVALAAFIWRARTTALEMGPNQKTKIFFPVDMRSRLEPPLPVGYFGNAVALGYGSSKAGELVNRPFSFAVGLVQDGIKRFTNDYLRSAIDYFVVNGVRATMPSLVGSLMVISWTGLGFERVDFGWGGPVQLGQTEQIMQHMTVFKPSTKRDEGKSITVVIRLPASSIEKFEQMVDF